MGGQHPPRAPVALLQDPQEPHEVAVADALQLADRIGPRLRIRLPRDQLDQLVVELRHIHEPRPGPGQAGPELRQEMPHPRLAPGDPVGLEQTHLPPAQAEPHPDRLVDLLGRGDPVLDEPERLAPDRLEEPVGDMGIDLLAHMQGIHPDGAQGLLRPLDGRGVGRGRGDDLGQRQKIDRVERMGDEDRPRIGRALLQLRGAEPRGRGPDRHAMGHLLDLRKDPVLEVEPLAHRFLDVVGPFDRLRDRGVKGDLPLCRHRPVRQLRQAGARIGHDLGHLARGLRIGVEDAHPPAVQGKARGPAPADDPAPDDCRRSGHCLPPACPARRGWCAEAHPTHPALTAAPASSAAAAPAPRPARSPAPPSAR